MILTETGGFILTQEYVANLFLLLTVVLGVIIIPRIVKIKIAKRLGEQVRVEREILDEQTRIEQQKPRIWIKRNKNGSFPIRYRGISLTRPEDGKVVVFNHYKDYDLDLDLIVAYCNQNYNETPVYDSSIEDYEAQMIVSDFARNREAAAAA